MDPDPDPGGPKTCGSGGSGAGFGSRSATLVSCLMIPNPRNKDLDCPHPLPHIFGVVMRVEGKQTTCSQLLVRQGAYPVAVGQLSQRADPLGPFPQVRIQDSQMNADSCGSGSTTLLKETASESFNLRNWRTSVYSTAYYIFFSSSAADWYVRVREKEHANEPRSPEEVDPPYLGKGFDIGNWYLRRNLHATYALFIQ